ncbi:hypothetical protein Tco_0227458 [Tanacetum coccineum]
MSNSAKRAQMLANSAVRNMTGKGSKQAADNNHGLGARDKNVFTRLGEKRRDIHSWLGLKVVSRPKHASDRRQANSEMSAKYQNRRRKEARNPVRSYVTCSSKRQREIKEEWDAAD